MLDVVTLRVVEAGMAACVLMLFYLVTYRQTRSAFAAYWSATILCAGVSTVLYLFNGSDIQWFANPVGNALGVLVAAFVWASTLAFAHKPVRWWALVIGPAIALATGLADDPANNVWAGGAFLLGGVAVYLALASAVLWRGRNKVAAAFARRSGDGGARDIVTALALASTLFCAFYALRLALFLTVGPDSDVFIAYAGGVPTTFALILIMVVATFGMTSLSQIERHRELQERVARDGLTGLLARSEFMTAVEEAATHAELEGATCALVMADLDHFKALNDTYGHAAGDQALRHFGAVCGRLLGTHDLAGRLGGEEFALLLYDTDAAATGALLQTMRRLYAVTLSESGRASTTVSFGVSLLEPGRDVAAAFEQADAALYLAKANGRNRIEFDTAL